MTFKIKKEEYVNKTFRIEKGLLDEMYAVCDKKGISLNKLVVQCVQYALSHLESEDHD